jgi:hypothetical protein
MLCDAHDALNAPLATLLKKIYEQKLFPFSKKVPRMK